MSLHLLMHCSALLRVGSIALAIALAPALRAAPQADEALAAPAAAASAPAAGVEAMVFRAYPESDGYSRIERDVGPSHRRLIERRLPFKVHFNELGKHGLLVAFRSRRPVGLLYERSEESDWGLVEIAWHVTLDLRIAGFEIVRGLGRDAKDLPESPFADQLAGASFDEVVAQLAALDESTRLAPATPRQSFTRTVLRSAAKALAVTTAVWDREIEKLHDQAEGFDLFPAAARFVRRTTRFELDATAGGHAFDVKVLYAYDFGNTLLGHVIWSQPRGDEGGCALRWVVDRERRVIVVRPAGPVRESAHIEDWSRLSGRPLAAPGDVEPTLAGLAQGLGTLASRLERRGRTQ
ncbi:MAG: hypothetical protein ACK5S5_18945 [Planctomycetota bacterium]